MVTGNGVANYFIDPKHNRYYLITKRRTNLVHKFYVRDSMSYDVNYKFCAILSAKSSKIYLRIVKFIFKSYILYCNSTKIRMR